MNKVYKDDWAPVRWSALCGPADNPVVNRFVLPPIGLTRNSFDLASSETPREVFSRLSGG